MAVWFCDRGSLASCFVFIFYFLMASKLLFFKKKMYSTVFAECRESTVSLGKIKSMGKLVRKKKKFWVFFLFFFFFSFFFFFFFF